MRYCIIWYLVEEITFHIILNVNFILISNRQNVILGAYINVADRYRVSSYHGQLILSYPSRSPEDGQS